MDKITKECAYTRFIVKKITKNEFETFFNVTCENKMDERFKSFIEKCGTHFLTSVKMGHGKTVRSNITKVEKNELKREKIRECMNRVAQQQIHKKDTNREDKYNCDDKDVENNIRNSVTKNKNAIHSFGKTLDGDMGLVRIGFEAEPIINIFQKEYMKTERLVDEFGKTNPISVSGILSWFQPRYAILMNRCRDLPNHRVSNAGTFCVKCKEGQQPSKDFMECVDVKCETTENTKQCENCPILNVYEEMSLEECRLFCKKMSYCKHYLHEDTKAYMKNCNGNGPTKLTRQKSNRVPPKGPILPTFPAMLPTLPPGFLKTASLPPLTTDIPTKFSNAGACHRDKYSKFPKHQIGKIGGSYSFGKNINSPMWIVNCFSQYCKE